MEIKNSSNPVADVVVVRESDQHKKNHVRLEIGSGDHNPRHANLTAAERAMSSRVTDQFYM